jgi:polar amino acid transport system substrate-binding protein
VDDLYNSRIGVKENTVESIYCAEDFGYSNVKTYDSYLDAILSLERNGVDCVVLDRAVAEAHVITHSQLSILDEYCLEDYRIGLPKGNDELRDAVNEALSELISDGTVQEIIRNYIRP